MATFAEIITSSIKSLFLPRNHVEELALEEPPTTQKIDAYYREVFLCCPHFNKPTHHFSPRRFFIEQLAELDRYIEEQAIFFNKEEVFRYCRFINTTYGVLRIFVPETAIQGQIGKLTLKPNLISLDHIHGCYVNVAKEVGYFLNPLFKIPTARK